MINSNSYNDQKLLEAILSGLGESICVIGQDLTIQWVNPEFEKHGGSYEQIKGKHCYAAFYHRTCACVDCPTLKAFQSGEVIRTVQMGYDKRIYEVTASPIRNPKGEILYVVELTRDITEKRTLEEELKTTNRNIAQRINELNGLYSLSTNAMIAGEETKFIKQLTKISVKALPSLSSVSVLAIRPNTAGHFKISSGFASCDIDKYNKITEYYEKLLFKLDNYDAEDVNSNEIDKIFSSIKEDGLAKFALHIPVIIQDDLEAVFSFFVLNNDDIPIENKNFLHEAAKQLYFLLQRSRLENQLIQSAKLATAGELTASIMHEIRNPLYGIRNTIEILIKDFPDLNDKVDNLISMSLDEVDRISGLLNQLLAFCKVSDEQMLLIDINAIMRDIITMNQNRLKKSSIIVEEKFGDIPEIEASASLIKQVFLNIIHNAIDAMPDGGKLKISTIKKKKNIWISIADTGVGISQSKIDRIFQPFFTTKDEVHGVGLGLSVSYGIVKRHHGQITVNSVLNKGSVFTIILPIRQNYYEQ